MGPTRILWISDERKLPAGWPGYPADWRIEIQGPDEVIAPLAATSYGIVVLDLPFRDFAAAEILESVRRAIPGIPVLVRDPHASISEPCAWRTWVWTNSSHRVTAPWQRSNR